MTEALNIAQTMAARMRELRAAHGLTLQQVADRANTGKSHIWELENGRSKNPSIEMAVGLARAFGVSIDYLTGLSSTAPDLHPDAFRIAIEIDTILRKGNSPSPDQARDVIEECMRAAYTYPAYMRGMDDKDEDGVMLPGSPYDRGRYDAYRAIRALRPTPEVEAHE